MLKRQMYVAITIAVCVSCAATVSIAAAERLRYSDFHKGIYGETFRFVSLSAHELMTAPEFEGYTRALNQYFCETAQKKLHSAFVRTYSSIYPEFDQPRTGLLSASYRSDIHRWASFARRRFPGYAYCLRFRALLKVRGKIRKAGIAPPPFDLTKALFSLRRKQPSVHYDHPLIQQRDSHILSIIWIAQDGYAPAMFRLLEMGRPTGVLKLSTEIEFFLRLRLRSIDSGYRLNIARMAQLRENLSDIDRKMLEQLAMSARKPRLMDMFLGRRRLLHPR